MNGKERQVLLAVIAAGLGMLVFPNSVFIPLAGFLLGTAAIFYLIGFGR